MFDERDPLNWKSFDRILQSARILEVVKHVPEEASILEIGAGSGYILARAKQKKNVNKLYAIDRDPVACKETSEKYPFIKVENKSIEEWEKKIEIDIVFLLEILEHLKNPFSVLKKVKKLNPKRIIITVPNKNSIEHPEHVNIFTENSLEWLIRSAIEPSQLKIYPFFRDSFIRRNRILNKVLGRLSKILKMDPFLKKIFQKTNFNNSVFLIAVVDL